MSPSEIGAECDRVTDGRSFAGEMTERERELDAAVARLVADGVRCETCESWDLMWCEVHASVSGRGDLCSWWTERGQDE